MFSLHIAAFILFYTSMTNQRCKYMADELVSVFRVDYSPREQTLEVRGSAVNQPCELDKLDMTLVASRLDHCTVRLKAEFSRALLSTKARIWTRKELFHQPQGLNR